MKEYTVRPTDYLYKDNYGKIRCKFCKRWINKRLGYCEMCIDIWYEKKEGLIR